MSDNILSPRKIIGDYLRQALTDWTVVDAPREVDAVARRTVILWTSSAERLEKYNLTHLKWDLETWITVPPAPTASAFEDSLDRALIDYIAALEATENIVWSKGERGTLADTIDGYRVTLTVVAQLTNEE